MNKTRLYSPRPIAVIGFIADAAAFAVGLYGIVLFSKGLHLPLKGPIESLYPSVLPSILGFAAPLGGLPVLARFVIFLVAAGLFATLLALVSREIRRIQPVASALLALPLPYVYAGIIFLCSLMLNIRWSSEVHIAGMVLFSIGLLIPMFLMVAVGVEVKRLRGLVALAYSLISLPAEFVILLLIYYQYVPQKPWVLVIGGLALLGLNVLVYVSSIKKERQVA